MKAGDLIARGEEVDTAQGLGRGIAEASPRRSRATLLLGTCLLVYAAAASPAHAQNECGLPPPGGGTVTCEAGEYPDGITYDPVVADLTVVLEPGVMARDNVELNSIAPGVDLILSGPTDTLVESGSSLAGGVQIGSAYGTVAVAVDVVTTDAIMSAPGIDAEGNGSVDVSADIIVTVGDQSDGILATSLGDITVTSGSITTQGTDSQGIDAYSQGEAVEVISTGAVSTQGRNSIGILARSTLAPYTYVYSGPVTVTSNAVTTIGDASDGIRVYADNDVEVSSATVATAGTDSTGISGRASNGTVRIVSSAVSTGGDSSIGIFASSDAEATMGAQVHLTSGAVSTSGDGSAGIDASGDQVFIESGTVWTGGDNSGGISARSVASNFGYNNAIGVKVTSGSVTTSGANSIGISAFAEYAVSIGSAGIVSTGGDHSTGILARSVNQRGAAVTVTSNGVETSGESASAINVYGSSGVSVTSASARTGGHGSVGITADSAHGPVIIDSNSVTTAGELSGGILADGNQVTIASELVITEARGSNAIQATAFGDVRITSGSIETNGSEASSGIVARSQFGGITIDSGSIDVIGHISDGISAVIQSGDGTISITSDWMRVGVGGRGARADGIYALGRGEIIVDSGDIDHAGSGNAIDVSTDETGGDVTVTSGNITKSGEEVAIVANTANGDVIITSASIESTFQSNVYNAGGIFAVSRNGSVTVDSGSIETANGTGIFAQSGVGIASVTSQSVTTGGHHDAITAISNFGDVAIVSGLAATTGDHSFGIDAHASGGGVSVTSATITTAGDNSTGIGVVASDGDANVVSTGTVRTAGNGSFGIAAAADGTVAINSNIVLTSGDGSNGINATQTANDPATAARSAGGATVSALGPNGGVTITSGSVTTSGADSAGIDALAMQGDVEIFSTGTVTTSGADSDGIVAASDNGFALVDANTVGVSGANADAIAIAAPDAVDVIVRGPVESSQGFAVQADGAPASVSTTPSGTIIGRVHLTDGADTLANAGTFDAIGASAFGGGADVFNNGGTTRSVNGAALLGGLEQFNSSGIVTMADGAANDRLTVGDFTGLAGSRLIIDVDFSAGTADVLVTGAATGSTLLEFGAGGLPAGFTGAILVVDGAAGTSPTAFTLGTGGTIDNGYVTSGLIFRASDFDFLLGSAPNQPVFETSQVGEIVTNVWQQSADAVFAQIQSASDRPEAMARNGRGFGVWGQMWAGGEQREGSQAFPIGAAATVFDVGYRQDYEGVQGGLDHQSDNFLFGVTFGLGSSDADFVASGNRLDIDIVNLGAYAGFRAGAFYVNALVKYDWLDVTTNPGPGLSAAFEANEWGAQVDAGARLEFGRLFAEPYLGISWISADIDDFGGGGAAISFDEAESLRGYAGLRLGGVFDTGGAAFAPFVGGRIIEEFEGENENDFILGSNIHFVDQAPGTHGELSAGLSVITGMIEVFVRGEMLIGGDDVDGESVRGGVRIRF